MQVYALRFYTSSQTRVTLFFLTESCVLEQAGLRGRSLDTMTKLSTENICHPLPVARTGILTSPAAFQAILAALVLPPSDLVNHNKLSDVPSVNRTQPAPSLHAFCFCKHALTLPLFAAQRLHGRV